MILLHMQLDHSVKFEGMKWLKIQHCVSEVLLRPKTFSELHDPLTQAIDFGSAAGRTAC